MCACVRGDMRARGDYAFAMSHTSEKRTATQSQTATEGERRRRERVVEIDGMESGDTVSL